MLSLITPATLSWLKIISFCITSLLALLGLLYDFKDKTTGRLTRWGKVNLVGLILAFFIGIAAQRQEDYLKQKADGDSEKRMEALVTSDKQIIQDDQKTLKQLKESLGKTDKLITKTEDNLTFSKKIDLDTENTLQGVRRGMELAGDTISVSYEVMFSPDPSEMDELKRKYHDLEKRHSPTSGSSSWLDDDTFANCLDSDCGVIIGPKSPVMSGR